MTTKSMSIKHRFVRIILGLEVIGVTFLLLFSSQGFIAVRALKRDLQQKEREVALRESEISTLEDELAAWERDPFYVEKHAREKLAMAREGDAIYVNK